MKTYDEMARSALERIGQYEAEKKKRRKSAVRIAVPAVSFCLVALLGFGAWQTGLFQRSPAISAADVTGVPIPKPDGTIQREKMPDVIPEHPILRPGDEGYVAPVPTPDITATAPVPAESEGLPTGDGNVSGGSGDAGDPVSVVTGDGKVVTGDAQKGPDAEVTQGYIYLWWNNLSVSGPLYFAIGNNPGSTFSVLATYRPATANITDFTYEGKTLAEWAAAADEERMLPEKMAQLLKQGDELKYGTALYETGTPDGIKWDRAWYENQVAFFGDLLDRYIVDGQFLREALEADIAALPTVSITTPDGTTTTACLGETAAREQYTLAYNAYLETVLPDALSRLTESGIPCQRVAYRNSALSLLVTEEQLKNLPLDDLGSWAFDLYSGDLKAAVEPVTDETGLQVVN